MTDLMLYTRTATECVAMLKSGDVSPTELVHASIERIEAVDGDVNALPDHCFERALESARVIEADPSVAGVLRGLPIAVKDYNDVGGVRTTYGSPIFAKNVPERSDATVERLESNGAIPMAKSNVPEWAGGNTFNPVHGTTRNPWDLSRTAGGSSGGSAAALATGQVWLATGNDLGGSLRTPAAFNSIVGLRPSPGRVPRGQRLEAFDTLWVEGPMGRTVEDTALMLDAGCGAHPHDPLAFDSPGFSFAQSVHMGALPKRVAFSSDLGIVPMAAEVASICAQSTRKLEQLGVQVTDDAPDFTGAVDAFQTQRACLLATMMESLLAEHRQSITPVIIDNVERGLNIKPAQIFEANRQRWALAQRMARFFETHDLLICPAVSIPPFPVDQAFVDTIDGTPCETYIDWFAITFALTLTACPVVSLPCGFTGEGLPVALQLVGKPHGEAALLRAAHHLELVLGIAPTLPIDPRGTI
jgi:amidase